MKGHTRSMRKLADEARKCILLCANCHSEVERGVTEIPEELMRSHNPGSDNLDDERAA